MLRDPSSASTPLLAIALAVSFSACSALKGSNIEKAETRTVPPFTRVRASGGLTVQVSVGPQRVGLVGDDNIVPLIATEVEDGQLSLRFTGEHGFRPSVPLEIAVATPTLEAVTASGGCVVDVVGISGPAFTLAASGGTSLRATGTSTSVTVAISGGTTLEASSLRARQVKLVASGGTSAKLFATESVEGSASGGTSVTVLGGPKTRALTTSGGSNVSYP